MSNNTEIEATFILEPSSLEADFLIGFSPNKISELENDSKFITDEELNIATENLVTSISQVNQDLQNTKKNISNKIDANTDLINSTNVSLTELINKEKKEREEEDENNSQEAIRLYNTLNVVKANKDTVYSKEEIDGKIASIYTIKGSVESFAKLPLTSSVGDVYNVLDTGANYVWTAEGWDKLSETVNLEPYLLKKEALQTFSTIETTNRLIKNLEDTLELKVDKLSGYSLLSDIEIERLSTLYNYDDTELKNNIQSLQINKQNKLVAGQNISIVDDVISFSGVSGSEWGKITGSIENQVDLKEKLEEKASIDFVEKKLNNISSVPIGSIIPVVASNNYIPNGCLACNGAEYNKEDFEALWDNYLISNLLNTCTYADYNTEISTNGQCSKFAVLPFGYNSSILTVIGSPTVTTDGIASGFSTSNYLQKTNLFNDDTSFNVLEFEIEITPSTTSEHYMQIRTNDNNNQIVFTQSGNKLTGFVTTSGTSYNFNSLNIVINANVKYLIKAKHTADRFYLEVKNQETGAIQSGNIASVMPLINEKTVLYVGMSVFGGFTRNPIDLKKVSVSIDGKNILKCFEGDTFKVPTTINDKYTDFVVVANGMTDDCLVTWNTLVELENYLKGV